MTRTQGARRNPQATRKGLNVPIEVPLRQSCPSGLTKGDLEYLFSPETLTRFYKWMTGQTVMLCNGKRYVYKRAHGEHCMKPHGFDKSPAHKEGDPITWACEYLPGGSHEATGCSGLPAGTPVDKDAVLSGHGAVTYSWDVERFILGLPVID